MLINIIINLPGDNHIIACQNLNILFYDCPEGGKLILYQPLFLVFVNFIV